MAFVKTSRGWFEKDDPRIAGGMAPNGSQADLMRQGGTPGYQGIMSGFPGLEAGAYDTSGYKGIFEDPDYGMIPQATMDAYWGPAVEDAMNKSRQAYASIFSERGMPPSGIGAQGEMLGRRGTELNIARAGANLENATRGASARAQAKGSISGNRYKVLTDPMEAYYQLQRGLGTAQPMATGGGTIARPSTPGMGGSAGMGGPGAAQRPQNMSMVPGAGGTGADGHGGHAGGDVGVGPDPDYIDTWNQPGYPGGPNEVPTQGGIGSWATPNMFKTGYMSPYQDIWAEGGYGQ